MKKLAPALFLCSALLLSGCTTNRQSGTTTTTPVEKERPTAVSVQTVSTGNIVKANHFSGRTKSSGDTSVTAETVGKIEKVHVSVGDQVQKGDLLLTIDGTDLHKNIEQARVSLETAQTSYDNATGPNVTSQLNQLENAITNAQLNYDEAQRNYTIYAELYEAETITEDQFKKIELSLSQAEFALKTAQQNYDTTKNEVLPQSQKVAAKSVEQAQLAYDTAKSNVSKLTIIAPTSGTITTANFKTGEMIAQSAPAFVISNLNTLEVELQVTETDVMKFKVGHSLEVKISGETVTGTVSEVSKVPHAQTGLYTVDLAIDNSNNHFLAGMAAEVALTAEKSEDAVILPKKAVFEEEGQHYVYVCQNEVAVKTPVTVGLASSHDIAITSGIESGARIVVGGLSLITDGSYIYPVEKED